MCIYIYIYEGREKGKGKQEGKREGKKGRKKGKGKGKGKRDGKTGREKGNIYFGKTYECDIDHLETQNSFSGNGLESET